MIPNPDGWNASSWTPSIWFKVVKPEALGEFYTYDGTQVLPNSYNKQEEETSLCF